MLEKIMNEYMDSVKDITNDEGILAGIIWAMVLPVFMISTIMTNLVVGEKWNGGLKEEC